jgi:glycosyltransferase involved in cell wall biosynthesis
MVLKGFPRISETFISNEIRLLEGMGLPIRIFSMRRPRENFTHDSVREIRAPVHYLPERILTPALPGVLLAHARLAARSPERYRAGLGAAVRRFRRSRKAATWKHFLQAGHLVERWLGGSGVTHLHAHFAHSPTSVALFASRLSGLSFSFTAHAKDIYTSAPEQLKEKIDLARFVVTCTEYNRRYLEAVRGAGVTPIHRVYHGIDLDLFADGRPKRRPEPPYRLLTVARLTPKKGIATVIAALALLKAEGVDFRHTLIGDGEDRARVLKAAGDAGLGERFRWIGTRPHHVVLEHYRAADLFLLACQVAENGDRDGIPNVLAESLAMGVPVVATGVSAIPELIQDGETGLLVPPGDPRAVADAARRLLADADLRDRMVRAGMARVRADFDNRATIGRLAAVLRREKGLPPATTISAGPPRRPAERRPARS